MMLRDAAKILDGALVPAAEYCLPGDERVDAAVSCRVDYEGGVFTVLQVDHGEPVGLLYKGNEEDKAALRLLEVMLTPDEPTLRARRAAHRDRSHRFRQLP